MDNPLFEYSAIVDRPRRSLPRNARMAVWLGVNIEHYAFGAPALSLVPPQHGAAPDSLNYGWRDYGARVGIFRLLSAFNALGVRGTAIINSEVLWRYPSIVAAAKSAQWGWAAHGRNNSITQDTMDISTERAYLQEVTADLEAGLGHRPRGWLGPARCASLNTNQLLAELGYTHSLDWGNDDQPYLFSVEPGGLASIPYSVEVNDIVAYVLHGYTGPEFQQMITDHFDALYQEANAHVFGLSIHPFLSGQPSRVKYLCQALEHILERDGVWMATSEEIADWYLATL